MIGFCPHCCNRSKQVELAEQAYQSKAWAVDDGEEVEFEGTYYVYKCEICSEILLYHQTFDFEPKLLYPEVSLHSSVPERVSKIYEEALRIKHVAPNAFAVQIRKALEALCQDRGTNKRNLAEQLRELADKGEIPPNLASASDILRLIGNLGAHAAEVDVHPLQALAIDKFFKAIIEYVYVCPARIEEFHRTLKRSNEET